MRGRKGGYPSVEFLYSNLVSGRNIAWSMVYGYAFGLLRNKMGVEPHLAVTGSCGWVAFSRAEFLRSNNGKAASTGGHVLVFHGRRDYCRCYEKPRNPVDSQK